jgi:hypothetical protein
MIAELAKLYIDFEGKRYRVKVFANTVGIERQPNGDNILLSKADHRDDAGRVYNADTGAWDYWALGLLLKRYPDYGPQMTCAMCGHELFEDGGCTNHECPNF